MPKDARLDRLASFLLSGSRDSLDSDLLEGDNIRQQAEEFCMPRTLRGVESKEGLEAGSESSSTASPMTSSCLIQGMLATHNAWRWKIQQSDPSMLNCPKLALIMDKLNRSCGVVFDLRLAKGRLASVVLQHCVAITASVAARGTGFKVGITSDPHNRWFNESFGYARHSTYSCMTIIGILKTMEAATYAEAALIREFRDHALCDNQALGGEGVGEASPAFVYVVSGRAVAPKRMRTQ